MKHRIKTNMVGLQKWIAAHPRKNLAGYFSCDGRDLTHNEVKIGRSKHPEKRLVHLRGGNPRIELLAICREDIELLLHKKYAAQNVYLEWFQLSQYEVDEIIRDYKFIRYPKRLCSNTK